MYSMHVSLHVYFVYILGGDRRHQVLVPVVPLGSCTSARVKPRDEVAISIYFETLFFVGNEVLQPWKNIWSICKFHQADNAVFINGTKFPPISSCFYLWPFWPHADPPPFFQPSCRRCGRFTALHGRWFRYGDIDDLLVDWNEHSRALQKFSKLSPSLAGKGAHILLPQKAKGEQTLNYTIMKEQHIVLEMLDGAYSDDSKTST